MAGADRGMHDLADITYTVAAVYSLLSLLAAHGED